MLTIIEIIVAIIVLVLLVRFALALLKILIGLIVVAVIIYFAIKFIHWLSLPSVATVTSAISVAADRHPVLTFIENALIATGVTIVAFVLSIVIGLLLSKLFNILKISTGIALLACALLLVAFVYPFSSVWSTYVNVGLVLGLGITILVSIKQAKTMAHYNVDNYKVSDDFNMAVYSLIVILAYIKFYPQWTNFKPTWGIINPIEHSVAFTVAAGVILLGMIGIGFAPFELIQRFKEAVQKMSFMKRDDIYTLIEPDKDLKSKSKTDREKAENKMEMLSQLLDGLLEEAIANEVVKNLVLDDDNDILMSPRYFEEMQNLAADIVRADLRISENNATEELSNKANFANSNSAYHNFISYYCDDIELLDFDDGPHFVHAEHRARFSVCASCGLAEEHTHVEEGEWYCSSICAETEKKCLKIKQRICEEEFGKSAIYSPTTLGGAQIYTDNYKMVNAEQRHGFAAENANTKSDNLFGKHAETIGGNNAKDGPDRVVDGQLIQTKYCKTAQATVNAAFDSKTGEYRYKGQQLEVPKGQENEAIKLFEQKIKDGKVPGVTDPAEAKNIIRKGNITYQQAVNITKFGTFESLVYDASTASIVAIQASGICFIIAVAQIKWRGGDYKTAIQVGLINSAKAGGKAFAGSIITAQVQRIPQVSKFLESAVRIKLSPAAAKNLVKGVTNISAASNAQAQVIANRILRGAVAMAVVQFSIVAVMEAISFARNRISGAQLLKNLVIAGGGIAGGTAGALAGAAIGGIFGPLGAGIGAVVGGIAGGIAGAKVAKVIIDGLIEDDAIKMLRYVNKQIEYLVVAFALHEEEIKELTDQDKLRQIVDARSLRDMFQSRKYRAYANKLIKPEVVRIIARREPQRIITEGDIIDAAAVGVS